MLTDIIVIGVFISFSVLGYLRGFVKSVVSLVRISTSVIIAFLLANPVAKLLNSAGFGDWLGWLFATSDSNGRIISVCFVTLIFFIILRIILSKFVNLAEKARETNKPFGIADRLLGGLFGMLRFVFMFCIIAVIFRLVTFLPLVNSLHDLVFGGSVVTLWFYNLITKTILAELLAAASNLLGTM